MNKNLAAETGYPDPKVITDLDFQNLKTRIQTKLHHALRIPLTDVQSANSDVGISNAMLDAFRHGFSEDEHITNYVMAAAVMGTDFREFDEVRKILKSSDLTNDEKSKLLELIFSQCIRDTHE